MSVQRARLLHACSGVHLFGVNPNAQVRLDEACAAHIVSTVNKLPSCDFHGLYGQAQTNASKEGFTGLLGPA